MTDVLEPIDVVIPVRHGRIFESLRYALRSIEANVAGLGTVWLIGDRPEWATGLEWIPDVRRQKWDGLGVALGLAAEHAGISERFAYWNDDIFALERLEAVPVLHGPTLAEHARKSSLAAYKRGMLEADRALRALGVEEPWSYELHVPMPMVRSDLAGVLERLERIPAGQGRSMYGNLARIGGTRAPDVKVYGARSPISESPFVSTTPASFAPRAVAGRTIRTLFPEPSRFEE